MPSGNDDNKARAVELQFRGANLWVTLEDGRQVGVPLDRYPTLQSATSAQRNRWRLIGRGHGFHWPDLDLDLSTQGLIEGWREGFPMPPRGDQTDQSQTVCHVRKVPDGWEVVAKRNFVVARCPTQAEAVRRAKKMARADEVIVHGRDGRIRDRMKLKARANAR
ncbi:MAG: DUF2442 domain-containing protein [Phycisphaeraceae bacterium]|jgi:hypothetical protein|nr:DUF2442 domain-containing protein [Phycisphaeraceae bacterium]